ncbi:MAG TPA: acyl-CoA dehydrogenase family protein [Burkholderiales bacterium]|nr:acyl-CoA dehydrogenase family protein [Burkholderiales bacterium]
MSEISHLAADATSRVFRALGDPQALDAAASADRRASLWRALEQAGLTRAWVPESLGGAGASLADGFEVLRVAGSFAVAVPLAETLLAGWLLAQGGIEVPAGALTAAPARAADRLAIDGAGRISGTARAVPFARDAAHVALVARRDGQAVVALAARAQCALTPGESQACEPRDLLRFEAVPALALGAPRPGLDEERVLAMGAAVRAAQMSGALEAILERTATYAGERVAFERPIARFQAVQHALARLASEAAAALAAAGSAADALDGGEAPAEALLLEVASAKIRAGEAAGAGAAIAHQVHGAIGFSAEHPLHRYTQRLWAWRDDFGGESEWAARLGRMLAARGAEALWPLLASR